jgi:hypothetical protein
MTAIFFQALLACDTLQFLLYIQTFLEESAESIVCPEDGISSFSVRFIAVYKVSVLNTLIAIVTAVKTQNLTR